MDRRFVVYYRVRGGHDLDEQVQCVEDYAREVGGKVIKSYRDEETSKRPERPELRKALAYAKRKDAALIVATLRGLSRDVAFLRMLLDSGVDFVACDLPDANGETIPILTALAEYEARVASQRSKRALAAYRASGGKLGAARPEGRNLNAEARAKGARHGAKAVKAQADEAYRGLAPLMRQFRESGWTLRAIADWLNEAGHRTRRGQVWNAMQVSRVLKRFGGE